MNPRGHAATLVPSHPGNTNAAKAGVYSRRMLESRVSELEERIQSSPAAEVRRDVARRDLAGLMALVDALDAALAAGVVAARGQPKDLVRMRLRASNALRTAALEYDAANTAVENLSQAGATDATDESPSAGSDDLVEQLTEELGVTSLDAIHPVSFDAETFLAVIASSSDPAIRPLDRRRAHRFLVEARSQKSTYCGCSDPLRARDMLEFDEWVRQCRERSAPAVGDPALAAIIRHVARGVPLEEASLFHEAEAALEWVVGYEKARVRGEAVHEGGDRELAEDARLEALRVDPVLQPLWRTMLSPAQELVRERLAAYAALEEAGAFRRCVCEKIELLPPEPRRDARVAFYIRMFVRSTVRAAYIRARFPESFIALRDLLDDSVRAEVAVASVGEEAGVTATQDSSDPAS